MPEIYLFFWSICTAAPSAQVGVFSCFSSFVIDKYFLPQEIVVLPYFFPVLGLVPLIGIRDYFLLNTFSFASPLQNNNKDNNNVVLMTLSDTLNL